MSNESEMNSRDPVPSVVVDVYDGDDDDPPPYTAVAPLNHVGWPFGFTGIPYSAEVPLAPFQASAFHPEGVEGQHTLSVPLMPYRLFKFGSHRSLFARNLPFDQTTNTKDGGRTRKYGGILVGAAVIIFLMVLSLLVRFVVEKSFWRS